MTSPPKSQVTNHWLVEQDQKEPKQDTIRHSKARSSFMDLLQHHIRFSLDIVEHGTVVRLGPPENPDARFVIEINDPGFYGNVLSFGNLGLGEAYMQDGFRMLDGKLEDFIEGLLASDLETKLKNNWKLALKILPFRLKGWIQGQTRSVRHHYDTGMDLFYSFLDNSLTYSCGYAIHENDSLEQLQINKFHRICNKLRLKENETLLDIGSGYGGMLIYAALHFGIKGVGVTNSKNHFETGNRFIAQNGLNDRVRIILGDFREVEGQFDKVVSIGMLEHLPRKQYGSYFRTIYKLMKEEGLGLVHCVGANAATNRHDYFIQKYIFPMSSQPRLSELTGQLEKNSLAILDVENMIRHYGYTAQHWLNNFKKNRETLTHYPKEYLNCFEYYLACCVAAAKASDSALYQVLFMKNHTTKIPLKRV
jgi:cyclopropane-fatty-acyl-phospholipid synthase